MLTLTVSAARALIAASSWRMSQAWLASPSSGSPPSRSRSMSVSTGFTAPVAA
jgi:frataxin-like iron-binding protein CyaY